MRLLFGALSLEFIFAVVAITPRSFQLFFVYVTLWADISHLGCDNLSRRRFLFRMTAELHFNNRQAGALFFFFKYEHMK